MVSDAAKPRKNPANQKAVSSISSSAGGNRELFAATEEATDRIAIENQVAETESSSKIHLGTHPGIHLGTSAFTAAGWEGAFYPAGMQPRDFLTYYATKFDTVEVDSTFYRTPSAGTVRGWYAKTPKNFIFSLKVPQEITHEKCLQDCDAACKEFLAAADILREKLGPILFQFGYFNKSAFASVDAFLARLLPFLDKLPKDHKFAVEIRNKHWLVPKFADALRERRIALALIDQAWMPRPAEWFARFDPITADFAYIRWLGDRKGIEKITKSWDKTIVDRRRELSEWARLCVPIVRRGVVIFAYANNHYAGHGPATVAQFLDIWNQINS
ncbi:MAG TPA: DUF72 domain-containing protein [Candidatus Dormibacteraeota bacterium]|nr:DUF72 domain-containing protein [Candidatus Dormibacteraeota bacterium]